MQRSSNMENETALPLRENIIGAFRTIFNGCQQRQDHELPRQAFVNVTNAAAPVPIFERVKCQRRPARFNAAAGSGRKPLAAVLHDPADVLPGAIGPEQFILPVDGALLSSRFGQRGGRFHRGVDLAAWPGEPVRAAADGTVTYVAFEAGYGNVVEVEHSTGLRTLYAHNSCNLCTVGERVAQGQTIARVGATGRATGPHLHWEVRTPWDESVNPERYLDLGPLHDL